MKRLRGFTLIEILIVLTVFTLCAAFALSLFKDVRREARLKAAARLVYQNGITLTNALEEYRRKNGGAWPATNLVTPANNYAVLNSGGYIKGSPFNAPMYDALSGSSGGPSSVNWSFVQMSAANCDVNGDGVGDYILRADEIGDAACQTYNDLYAGGWDMNTVMAVGTEDCTLQAGRTDSGIDIAHLATGCRYVQDRRKIYIYLGP